MTADKGRPGRRSAIITAMRASLVLFGHGKPLRNPAKFEAFVADVRKRG